MDPIQAYLDHDTLPMDQIVARQLRGRVARYVVVNDGHYKRLLTLPLLRCFTPQETSEALEEIHEGLCGKHTAGGALAARVIRQGYYWPALKADAH